MNTEEQRAYSKGYAAGRRKAKLDRAVENFKREQQAFLDKAFLAALPFAMAQSTWTIGEKPINTMEERVAFAWRIARRALSARSVT